MTQRKILIFENSSSTQTYLSEMLVLLGFQTRTVTHKNNFLTAFQRQDPHLILLGCATSPAQIKTFATVVARGKRRIPIVYLAEGTEEVGTEIGLGSDELCCLPSDLTAYDLKRALDRMIEQSQEPKHQKLDGTIIGQSPAIVEIKTNIARLSQSEVTILVTGESGTGKELVARAVHDLSPRAAKPFVKVNSAALPENLLESELFGYERGAFTGAWRNKPGKFVLADSGSLLLDEIGEIPLQLQPKLLQALEDNELFLLGSTANTRIDVRILASTNCDLQQNVREGRFRSDLFYRLNVVTIHIPPLRERPEDIPCLYRHFLKKHAVLNGEYDSTISEKTHEQMCRYPWPGNVRELENMIKSISLLGGEEALFKRLNTENSESSVSNSVEHGNLSSFPTNQPDHPTPNWCLKEVAREAARKAETATILDVLSYTQWNRRKAAKTMKISYKALLNKIKEYEIEEKYQQLLRDQKPEVRDQIAAGTWNE
jgi:two-component system response regulator AtoC